MGSICHSSVVSTTQSARDNDDANIDCSSQHDVSATWKFSEKNYGPRRSELNLHNKSDLRAVLGSRKTKGSC